MELINCNIHQFCEIIRDKNVICFGAGKIFKDFFAQFSNLNIEKNVIAVLDNNENKVGTKIRIADKEIPVISMKDLCCLKNICILITCADIYDVYQQLCIYSELKDVLCFAANYIKSETNAYNDEQRQYPSSYRLTEQPLIPKKIHYCWFGGKPISDKYKKWMESWRKYCPDYEIIEWNEDNYDITKNQYMYEAYKAQKWGFVPDFARMDIIYEHGGIYLDTDVELTRNLDDLLYQPAFVGAEYSGLINWGSGFGAEKNCIILKEICDMYRNLHFINEDGSYNLIPAPTLQKQFFEKKGYLNSGNYQILDNVLTVYPEKVLAPKCFWTGRIMPTEYTFAIHHYDASWIKEEDKIKLKKTRELFREVVDNWCTHN